MNMRKKNIYKASVIIITLAFILPISTLTSLEITNNGLTTVSILPTSQIVEKNETFNISVYVDPSEPIIGASFNLYFDPDLVHANSVTEDNLFNNYLMFNDGDIDNVNGMITDVFLVAVPDDNVSDPGSFVDIEFTAQQQFGISVLDLEEVTVINISSIELPLEVTDGEVIVGGIDTEPPVTTHIFDGTIGENGWYISDVTITLTATDDLSGVDVTYYRINGDTWAEYVGSPVVVSDDGEHTLEYYSVDNASNEEVVKGPFDFKIDQTSPVTTCILDGIMEGGVYITDVTVTLTATDDMSGVNYTMYSVNNMGEWYQYMDPFVVSDDGNHIIWFYSVDLAGNTENPKSESFTIQHPCPIEIEISGGIGINAVITNTGEEDITDLEWSITITGGLFGFIDKQISGTIPTLAADDSATVESGVFFGLGDISITVTADCAEETAEGLLLLFYILL